MFTLPRPKNSPNQITVGGASSIMSSPKSANYSQASSSPSIMTSASSYQGASALPYPTEPVPQLAPQYQLANQPIANHLANQHQPIITNQHQPMMANYKQEMPPAYKSQKTPVYFDSPGSAYPNQQMKFNPIETNTNQSAYKMPSPRQEMYKIPSPRQETSPPLIKDMSDEKIEDILHTSSLPRDKYAGKTCMYGCIPVNKMNRYICLGVTLCILIILGVVTFIYYPRLPAMQVLSINPNGNNSYQLTNFDKNNPNNFRFTMNMVMNVSVFNTNPYHLKVDRIDLTVHFLM